MGTNSIGSCQGRRRRKREKKNIDLAIVYANNYYAGFGPKTANIFMKMVGLPEAVWSKEEDDKSYLHNNSNIQHHERGERRKNIDLAIALCIFNQGLDRITSN